MGTSPETVNKVRNILRKLDRSIDDARARRQLGRVDESDQSKLDPDQTFERPAEQPQTGDGETPRLARRIQPRGFDS